MNLSLSDGGKATVVMNLSLSDGGKAPLERWIGPDRSFTGLQDSSDDPRAVRFNEPFVSSAAISADGEHLYVADRQNSVMRRVISRAYRAGIDIRWVPLTSDGCHLFVSEFAGGSLHLVRFKYSGGPVISVRSVAAARRTDRGSGFLLLGMAISPDDDVLYIGRAMYYILELGVNTSALPPCTPPHPPERHRSVRIWIALGVVCAVLVVALCTLSYLVLAVPRETVWIPRRRSLKRAASLGFSTKRLPGSRGTADVYKGRLGSSQVVGLQEDGRASPLGGQVPAVPREKLDVLSTLRHSHLCSIIGWQQQRPPVLPPPPPPSRIIAPPYDGIHFASGLRSQKRAQWLLQPGCDSSHASGSRRAMSSQLREGGAEGMRAKQPYFLGQKNENVVERMGSSACSNGVAAACTEEEPGAALELKTGPYGFPQAPVFLKGKVVTGFGRGGKLLGVPTGGAAGQSIRGVTSGPPEAGIGEAMKQKYACRPELRDDNRNGSG
ncbi:hypothetical protein CBR_g22011 [Chara braunii]|uniref:Uncharacterized protein n=1 Tax=Chara braunii TaxID=69332 RepID=A0A388L236_CHABU|nr:hypothetical protein CBR_g22011 [Chara braunii]|eukprot:GBG76263.1 hypothetical protein CBR_g22011 [Chara braunii]